MLYIRHATVDDTEALVRLKHSEPCERCSAPDERQGTRFATVGEGRAVYLIAERDEDIVGHAYLKLAGTPSAPEYPDIEDLYVREDCRGQGIGRRLLAACEDIAVASGFSRIGLSVNPTLNGQAMILYERLGYCDVGRPAHLDGIYAGAEDWCIEMAKPLDGSDSPSVFSKKE